jgi:hypothetical protein
VGIGHQSDKRTPHKAGGQFQTKIGGDIIGHAASKRRTVCGTVAEFVPPVGQVTHHCGDVPRDLRLGCDMTPRRDGFGHEVLELRPVRCRFRSKPLGPRRVVGEVVERDGWRRQFGCDVSQSGSPNFECDRHVAARAVD